MGSYYDDNKLDEIRSISIIDVCHMYGIDINRAGWCKIRPEKTPSCKLYTNERDGHDRYWDYGASEGGDVINLVMFLDNKTWKEACDLLADAFGIAPSNGKDYYQSNDLDNRQWAKLGVAGDLVTKNLNLNLDKYTIEETQEYTKQYQMSVNELRTQRPGAYVHHILNKIAIPCVAELRENYFYSLYSHYKFRKELNMVCDKIGSTFEEEFKPMMKELINAERLLHRATKGTYLDGRYKPRSYNVKEDYHNIATGKKPVQIGPVVYSTLKDKAYYEKAMLCYRSVTEEEYFTHKLNDILEDIPHSAFWTPDKINLAFSSKDEYVVNRCIERLRSITNVRSEEVSLDQVIGGAAVVANESSARTAGNKGFNAEL